MAKIGDYKNRMTSPIKATRIDPKTKKPVKTSNSKKKG